MKSIIIFGFLCYSCVTSFAQDTPYRIIQDSCIRKIVANDRFVYGLRAEGDGWQYRCVRSDDFGRTWQDECQLRGEFWMDNDRKIVYNEDISCVTIEDSSVYCAFGALSDDYMRTRTHGSIQSCNRQLGTPQMPWGIKALIVHDSLIVFSGWTDTPDGVRYSTNRGSTWQYSTINNGNFWADRLDMLGSLIVGWWNGSVFTSADTLATIVQRTGPVGVYQVQSLLSRADGLLLAIRSDFRTTHSQFYVSTDTAQTWQQVLVNAEIPEIESAAFAGDTLLIHLKSACTIVSVPDVVNEVSVRVELKSGSINLSGDYAKHPQSRVEIYDTIGRLVQRLSLNGDAASVGPVSFAFDLSLASVFVVCSSEGWTRVVWNGD